MNDVYNASDLKDIRRVAKQAKQAEADRHAVIVNIMSRPDGRAWFHSLFAECGIFATTFTLNALGSAFNEGKRSVALQIIADVVQFAPDQYIQMMREANDRSISSDRGHLGDNPERGRDDLGRADDPVGSGSVESEYDPDPRAEFGPDPTD